jgi:tetratricopeptide (TPR) repeat protein
LSHAFADPVAWERELERFLDDRVTDVRTEAGAELARAVVRTLAASLLRRGRRRAARDVLARWVERERGFAWSEPAWSLWLDLSELQIELGEHDDAELALRRCATDGPAELRGAALLRIARIATARHEPWAEELLDEALAAGVGNEDRLELALVGCERAVRVEHPDVARRWLDRAESVAKASGRRATAALLLARGEVLRLEGKEEEGVDAWMDALDASPGPDVRGRIHLRLGDRALRSGRRADAELHYNEALLAFEESDLPLREAWARLRFAAAGLDAEEHLKVARERFVAADLAAGVVAVDLARGAPEEGLAWHLERATAHARARHDAQRCRPPWTRADAERPERRLGAHRVALAACGGDVVRALGVEMEACVRAMRAGRSRSADPPVLRYIAAADLLSAHRSYDAARVLLDHLLARVTDGPAQRALQGAIARSPNVALTDALLDVLERAAAHPAQAVAEAAEVVGLRREKAALPSLVKLAAPGAHPVVRRAAIVALGRVGDPDTADVIDGALPDPGLSEPAAVALLLLGDRRGVDFHGRALAGDRRDLTGSPGEIVGRFGGPGYLLLLRNVALGSDAGALGALQGLGLLGDPRAVPVLLEALTGRSRPIAEVAAGALQILTGHSEDLDEPGGRTRFAQWWEANQARYRDGLRYRDGRVFDVGALLSRMDDDDSWTRRSAYDELVIATGCRLPFDADGPWRVQRSHVVAWRAWWHEHRAAFPAGGWYLDGERIG